VGQEEQLSYRQGGVQKGGEQEGKGQKVGCRRVGWARVGVRRVGGRSVGWSREKGPGSRAVYQYREGVGRERGGVWKWKEGEGIPEMGRVSRGAWYATAGWTRSARLPPGDTQERHLPEEQGAVQ